MPQKQPGEPQQDARLSGRKAAFAPDLGNALAQAAQHEVRRSVSRTRSRVSAVDSSAMDFARRFGLPLQYSRRPSRIMRDSGLWAQKTS
jgi:hypothetical protein